VADQRITFYMDEHVPPAVSQGLRRRGVDALTVHEAGMLGAPDDQHLVLSTREGRTIFTHDADFQRLHAADNPHSGIVHAPQHTPTGAIARASMLIYDVLSPEDMAGHEEFL
jgi:hypothetical protein